MVIFDLPGWLEIPVTFGLVVLTYSIATLIFALACFLLCLVYFLFTDSSK